MHTIPHRILFISSIMAMVVLLLLGMTAMTTIIRQVIEHPKPIFKKFEVHIDRQPVVMLDNTLTVVDPPYSLYINNNKSFEDNIKVLGNEKTKIFEYWPENLSTFMHILKNIMIFIRSRGSWEALERNKITKEIYKVQAVDISRTFDRLQISVSGQVNFSNCWDWNTRAIYMTILGRYEVANKTSFNEVTFLDAIIRNEHLPRALRHLEHKEFAEMTASEIQQWLNFSHQITNRRHDHHSLFIDHIHKVIYLNHSKKFPLDDFYSGSLHGVNMQIIVRYQVLSYAGWVPIREDVIGGSANITIT